MNKRWLGVALVSLLGCDGGVVDEGNLEAGEPCAGGKCDSVAAAPLEAIRFTDVARCWSEIDDSTDDPFFQLDSIHCELDGVDAAGVQVSLAFAEVRSDADADAETLRAGAGAVRISRFSPGDFPLSLRVSFMIDAQARVTGALGSASPQTSSWRWGYERTFESREALAAIAETPWALDLPFEAWPVVLWPGAELQAAWDADFSLRAQADYAFDVAPSGALAVGGSAALATAAITRDVYLRGAAHTPAQLGRHQQYFYAPGGDFAIDLAVGALRNDLIVNAQITGPGYYLVGADYGLTPSTPEALPTLLDETPPVDDDPPPADQPDAEPFDDAPDAGAPDDAPADPCGGACEPGDVCVAGACVIRRNQRQVTCNGNPGARCDAGEDGDCAEGNACVAGLCRMIECQTQNERCSGQAYRPCEADAHCAAGHACVNEVCARLSCQIESERCNTSPYRDCAEDTDCGEGHACAAGKCARLSCQAQSERCNSSPHRACDPGEDSDCEEGHVCNEDGRCERVSCQ